MNDFEEGVGIVVIEVVEFDSWLEKRERRGVVEWEPVEIRDQRERREWGRWLWRWSKCGQNRLFVDSAGVCTLSFAHLIRIFRFEVWRSHSHWVVVISCVYWSFLRIYNLNSLNIYEILTNMFLYSRKTNNFRIEMFLSNNKFSCLLGNSKIENVL